MTQPEGIPFQISITRLTATGIERYPCLRPEEVTVHRRKSDFPWPHYLVATIRCQGLPGQPPLLGATAEDAARDHAGRLGGNALAPNESESRREIGLFAYEAVRVDRRESDHN